jgi:hypothetical protein
MDVNSEDGNVVGENPNNFATSNAEETTAHISKGI